MNHDRRATTGRFGFRLDTELSQCVEQILDRPLPHSLRAIEPKRSLAQRDERGEKADRRAAVGHGKFYIAIRQPPAAAVDLECPVGGIDIHRDSKADQRIDHHPRVFALQRSNQSRGAVGQRRGHQRPVRQAFRSRRAHAANDRSADGLDGVHFHEKRRKNRRCLLLRIRRHFFIRHRRDFLAALRRLLDQVLPLGNLCSSDGHFGQTAGQLHPLNADRLIHERHRRTRNLAAAGRGRRRKIRERVGLHVQCVDAKLFRRSGRWHRPSAWPARISRKYPGH